MATHLGNNNEYHQSPLCPKCGKKMVLRDSEYGKFWGCPGYPECRSRVSYDSWIDSQADASMKVPVQLELELDPDKYTPEHEEAELRRIMNEDKPYLGFAGWDGVG